MTELLLSPPVAFLIYLGLVALLSSLGRSLAYRGGASATKSSLYTGGEVGRIDGTAPGYRPFFVIALFFAVLHLGILVFGSSGFTVSSLGFLAGLILILMALILG